MKILIGLILGLILFISFLNIGIEKVLAQIDIVDIEETETPQCCQLKHDINVGTEETFIAGDVVGPSPDAPCHFDYPVIPTSDWAALCLVDSIRTISAWIVWIALILTGIALVFAGITFITAAGNPEKVGKAKAIFLYSLIGIVVIALAELIPGIVKYFVGL